MPRRSGLQRQVGDIRNSKPCALGTENRRECALQRPRPGSAPHGVADSGTSRATRAVLSRSSAESLKRLGSYTRSGTTDSSGNTPRSFPKYLTGWPRDSLPRRLFSDRTRRNAGTRTHHHTNDVGICQRELVVLGRDASENCQLVSRQFARSQAIRPFAPHTDVIDYAAVGNHIACLAGPRRWQPRRRGGRTIRLRPTSSAAGYIRNGQLDVTKPLAVLARGDILVDWFDFWLNGHEVPDVAKAGQYACWRRLRDTMMPDRNDN